MATDACREWRGDLGMEALGRLEEPSRAALLADVDGCADCRDALGEITMVAGSLDLADAERVTQTELPDPSQELGDRIMGRLQFERVAVARKRRRSRAMFAGIVGVAAAVIVALVLVLAPNSGPHGTVVALHSKDPAVHAQATLYEAQSGTRVQLRVDGLDDREWYWLWITGANGKRVPAGTFSASSARENVTMTAALSLARTKRVWITDDKNHVVLDGYLG